MRDDCPSCRTLMEENTGMAHEISALDADRKRLVLSVAALKRELAQQRREDPLSEDVSLVLRLWLELCVSPSGRARTNIGLDSTRADVVRAALKRYTKGSRDDRRQLCMEAVQGLALRPFVVNGQRTHAGQPQQRYADIEHALGGEKKATQRIEEHAAYFRRASALESVRLEQAAHAAFTVWEQWCAAAAQARMREKAMARTEPPVPGRPQLHLIVDNTDREAA